MQDLIRGIKKITAVNEPKSVVKETVVKNEQVSVAPLLKRAFMFLEDKDWSSADEYCEKVLDQDPENAMAYLGKLMVELHVSKKESLRSQKEPFSNSNNYQKAIRFGDDELKNELIYINTQIENTRGEEIYNQAQAILSTAVTEENFKSAESLFESISYYRDSAELANACHDKAEEIRNEIIYERVCRKLDSGIDANILSAIEELNEISDYKDANEKLIEAKSKLRNTVPDQSSGACYVATAVYGSYDCPEVWTLRRYRDNQLAKSWYGRLFIHAYYAVSPTIVKWFGHTEWFKKMWKSKLDKMVIGLQAKGVESTPYEDVNF